MKLHKGWRQTAHKPRSSFSALEAESICSNADELVIGQDGGEGLLKIGAEECLHAEGISATCPIRCVSPCRLVQIWIGMRRKQWAEWAPLRGEKPVQEGSRGSWAYRPSSLVNLGQGRGTRLRKRHGFISDACWHLTWSYWVFVIGFKKSGVCFIIFENPCKKSERMPEEEDLSCWLRHEGREASGAAGSRCQVWEMGLFRGDGVYGAPGMDWRDNGAASVVATAVRRYWEWGTGPLEGDERPCPNLPWRYQPLSVNFFENITSRSIGTMGHAEQERSNQKVKALSELCFIYWRTLGVYCVPKQQKFRRKRKKILLLEHGSLGKSDFFKKIWKC